MGDERKVLERAKPLVFFFFWFFACSNIFCSLLSESLEQAKLKFITVQGGPHI